VTQPKTPLEYREKWKNAHVQGRIAIAIDEDGHVSEAKLLEASPKEAADCLIATAKTAKFKPRPGCGTFKTEMNFTNVE
jgi:outer membrane biosynthesis protein TonB